MALRRVYIVPLVVSIMVPVTFFITYTIAVLNDHVHPGFPYISDTGTQAPESCIFGQLMNLAAFMLSICVYVKYLEIQQYSELASTTDGIRPRTNMIGLILGLTSCLGLDVVANFQETNVLVVHMLGAFFCFGAGTLYFMLQTWISNQMPEFASRRLVLIRGFLVGICIVTTLSTIISGSVAFSQFKGELNDTTKFHWGPEDGGWEMHLVSTVSEWILCITYCIVILSFTPEFYNFELIMPALQIKIKKTNVEP